MTGPLLVALAVLVLLNLKSEDVARHMALIEAGEA